ncbi:MAG: hypothetical protein K5868_07550 [Lachnospiraceae bacterium]|nr:hypothetical protein [Lachnospiraceae bacterium]
MSLKINYNVSAMIANNSLKLNDNKLTTSLGKLSSGYKINSAKDDAAGLAISRRMHAQLKGLKAASQDAKDGVSVIEIADGALAEVHDILQRMNELSVKSANGTLVDGDRDAIQQEIAQLGEEIDRIGQTTEYNSQRLFTGEFDLKGYTNDKRVKVDHYSDELMYGSYKNIELGQFKFKENKTGDLLLESYNGSNEKKSVITRPDLDNEEFNVSGDIYHLTFKGDNGDEFTLDIAGLGYRDLIEDAEEKIRANTTLDSATQAAIDAAASEAGYPKPQTYSGGAYRETDLRKATVTVPGSGTDTFTREQEDRIITEYDKDGNKKSVTTYSTIKTTYTDGNNNVITLTEEIEKEETPGYDPIIQTRSSFRELETPNSAKFVTEADMTGYGAMTFQVGANEGQTLDIRFEKLSMETLGFKYQDSDQTKDMSLDMSTADGALKAIDQIKSAIGQISSMRSRLGAYQNRLEHTETNLATSDENMTAAYSRIMDTDMAEEMSNYSNLQIVSQAATSILAQANERPSQMLQLLQ